VSPPRGEERVVAAELVVVPVGAASAVVLDQEVARFFSALVVDFEPGVGDDWAWLRVAEAFYGPVVAEAKLASGPGRRGLPFWGWAPAGFLSPSGAASLRKHKLAASGDRQERAGRTLAAGR
jgi:hypothetical protein